WSSDVCSSDLLREQGSGHALHGERNAGVLQDAVVPLVQDVAEVALVRCRLRVWPVPRLVAHPASELGQRIHLRRRLAVVPPPELLRVVHKERGGCNGGNPQSVSSPKDRTPARRCAGVLLG